MQQPTASAPLPASSSFAGLLAALTEPAKRPASDWNDEELANDVATLSYESALKAHARYHSTDQSLTQTTYSELSAYKKNASSASETSQVIVPPNANSQPAESLDQRSELARAAYAERRLKDASITIRMSKAECAQLHKRAAEAGLSVSAYLRSCTFEAESLRAMVKEALAKLRTASASTNPGNDVPPRRAFFDKLAKILTFQRDSKWASNG
jgi:predicted DNA binding CopG/RHH family protein